MIWCILSACNAWNIIHLCYLVSFNLLKTLKNRYDYDAILHRENRYYRVGRICSLDSRTLNHYVHTYCFIVETAEGERSQRLGSSDSEARSPLLLNISPHLLYSLHSHLQGNSLKCLQMSVTTTVSIGPPLFEGWPQSLYFPDHFHLLSLCSLGLSILINTSTRKEM